MTVVFYGDKSNWFACYALWLFQYYGHQNVKVMNGGRAQMGTGEAAHVPLVKEVPSYEKTTYRAKEADKSIRAFREEVVRRVESKEASRGRPLSEGIFSGELISMPNYPQEGATRGGHIPGAVSIPWAQAVNEADSTFKTPEELRALYRRERGHARRRGHRLLPHRRAFLVDVVRAQVSARLPTGQELRRFLDRMG
jgi:thiosulfate/3-mercaptopyruvate sulfurtransferase